MRLAMLAMVGCAACFGQSDLKQFLALTPAQIAQVKELNASLDQAVNPRQQRIYTIQAELRAEYAKAAPDPFALGQRYQEIASITRELAALRAGVLGKVTALLTDAQKAQVRQISRAAVQQDLIYDASCAYLADPITVPTAAIRSGDFATILSAGVISVYSFGNTTTSSNSGCGVAFPISIRNLLALSDAQVGAIQLLIAASEDFAARGRNRTEQVTAEIRDELRQPAPDPLATGMRFTELIAISQQLQQADKQTREAARGVLSGPQLDGLKGVTDAAILSRYLAPAESCHLVAPPTGTTGNDYSGSSCANYF